MNIVLFEPSEIDSPISRTDLRVVHILNVLKRKIGDSTDVGIVNGKRGKATLTDIDDEQVKFSFSWGKCPAELLPIDLIIGLSRPQTSRKVLQEATSLGVRSICFTTTERGEPSYALSKLWTTDEWKRHVRAGVEQAFSTRFPEVKFGLSLSSAIQRSATHTSAQIRICMDNYESEKPLMKLLNSNRASKTGSNDCSVQLAIGPERGWTSSERDLFRANSFTLANLGERPLRTETATIASVSVISAWLNKRSLETNSPAIQARSASE